MFNWLTRPPSYSKVRGLNPKIGGPMVISYDSLSLPLTGSKYCLGCTPIGRGALSAGRGRGAVQAGWGAPHPIGVTGKAIIVLVGVHLDIKQVKYLVGVVFWCTISYWDAPHSCQFYKTIWGAPQACVKFKKTFRGAPHSPVNQKINPYLKNGLDP